MARATVGDVQFPLGTFTLFPPVRTISPANTMMTPSEVNNPISTMTLYLTITHSVPLKSIHRYYRRPDLEVERPLSTKHSVKRNQNRTSLESEKLFPHDDAQSVPSESQVSTEVTGEETLVGKYKPIMHAHLFVCPDRRCWTDGIAPCWTTKNGYKYHLQEACYQNPTATLCLKLAKGEPLDVQSQPLNRLLLYVLVDRLF